MNNLTLIGKYNLYIESIVLSYAFNGEENVITTMLIKK